MNSKRTLCVVAAACCILALQIAFFWLAEKRPDCGIIVYIFYTALSLGHVLLLFILEDRLGMRGAIGPGMIGSAVEICQVVMSLCFMAFNISAHTALFSELLIILLYIALVAITICAACGDGHRYREGTITERTYCDARHQELHRNAPFYRDDSTVPTVTARRTRPPNEHT